MKRGKLPNRCVKLATSRSGNPLRPSGVYRIDKAGHYQATLTFPAEGTRRWSIEAFTVQQPMPDLNVLPAGKVPGYPLNAGASPVALNLMISGLLCATVAAWFALRSRSRRKLGLAIIGLMLVGVGFASYNTRVPLPETQVTPRNRVLSRAETGQALFVAKGCVTCHLNQRIDRRYYDISTRTGPNLSKFSAAPDYLRQWLADPAGIKPDTRMPDLNLSPDEIEALIAFLNAD